MHLCSALFSRIEMSREALPEKACQLDSRYWRITNAKGDVEEVQGPGVVGKSPKFAFLCHLLQRKFRLCTYKYSLCGSLGYHFSP